MQRCFDVKLLFPEGIMKKQGSQLRKYLFYGLTLVLASAVIFLAIQGRRMEKEKMQQSNENVQNYTSTPIRVLAPPDLEILVESMNLEPGNEEEQLSVARHRIEIYNEGNVSYCEIQLKFDYVDADGEVLASMYHNITGSLLPDSIFILSDFIMNDIPVETADCYPSLIYADFEPVEIEQSP